jgi:hypothetical protein
MEETKDVLSKNKELDDRRTKEIAKLKLEGNKKDAEFKKWKDDASSKAVCLVLVLSGFYPRPFLPYFKATSGSKRTRKHSA